MYQCPHCKKEFAANHNLTRHIKSSVRCIKARGVAAQDCNFVCECGSRASRRDVLLRHQSNCLAPKMAITIKEYEITLGRRDKTIAKLEEQVKLLMTRPISVTNNHTNNQTINTGDTYNMKFYKQHALDNFEAITQPFLQGAMDQMTLEDISYGGIGFAKFAKKHFDHQHLLILDITRRKALYKDASGEVIVDPKLRALLERLGLAGFPPANKIFTEWSLANREDCFLNSMKSKLLTNLVDLTGWLKRVGGGKIIEDDSIIQSNFLDELVSGYTKEALHNYLERQVSPPLIVEVDNDYIDPSASGSLYLQETSGNDEIETMIEMDIASMASSEFDVNVGILSYEVDYRKGVPDEKNYWIEYKIYSKYG
jgi:hypothetical protein